MNDECCDGCDGNESAIFVRLVMTLFMRSSLSTDVV